MQNIVFPPKMKVLMKCFSLVVVLSGKKSAEGWRRRHQGCCQVKQIELLLRQKVNGCLGAGHTCTIQQVINLISCFQHLVVLSDHTLTVLK